MKANLDKKFKGIDGKEMSPDNPNMKIMIAQALFNGQGVGTSAEEKFAAYRLCNRLTSEQGELELDKDERNLLRSAACAALTPGAYGQIIDLIGEK